MRSSETLDKKEGQDVPWMKSLSSCSNKMKEMGYTEDFQVDKNGLTSFGEGGKHYKPEEIKIVNFYRFEGESDPGDNMIMYVIETNDGAKGTLVDGYGAYASEDASKFIVKIEEIEKKIPQDNA